MREILIPNDRPPYTQIMNSDNSIIINGYTLLVDVDKRQASIINSTKGGKNTMFVPERVAKESYEEIFELIKAKRENFDKELEEAKVNALAKVEQEFEEKRLEIENIYLATSKEIQVEVPGEESSTDESVENEEVTE